MPFAGGVGLQGLSYVQYTTPSEVAEQHSPGDRTRRALSTGIGSEETSVASDCGLLVQLWVGWSPGKGATHRHSGE